MKPLFDNSVAAEPVSQPIPHDCEQTETWGRRLVRENFLVLLLTALFLIVLTLWEFERDVEKAKDFKEISNGVFYALLALLGVRPLARQVVPPAAIQVDNAQNVQSGGPTSIGTAAGNVGNDVARETPDPLRARDDADGDVPAETVNPNQKETQNEN